MIYRCGQPHKDHRDPPGSHPFGDQDVRLLYEMQRRGGVLVADSPDRERTR